MNRNASAARERDRASRRLRIAHSEIDRGYDRPVGAIRAQVRQLDRATASTPGSPE